MPSRIVPRGGKVGVRFGSDLRERPYKIVGDEGSHIDQAFKLTTELLTSEPRHLCDGYAQGEFSLEADLGISPILFADTEFEELRFTFQKIGGQVSDLCVRNGGIKVHLEDSRRSAQNVQSSVPILTSTVMQELQSSTIFDNVRIVRGWSVIRLYGTQPVFQLLREWTLPDFAIFEFSSGLVDGKLKAILVGGSTSPQELCCNPNQPIEGSAELIEELAQLKGEVIFRN